MSGVGIFATLASRFPSWRSAPGFWASLLLFALLFGLFLARVAAPYQRVEHLPSLGQALWIAPAVDGPVAYFRREFSLDSQPLGATVELAAPDGFELYVNGTRIDAIDKPSRTVAAQVDIGNYLMRGINVIALRVARSTFPGSAGLRAIVHWREPGGSVGTLPTDSRWRVAPNEERQRGGSLAWHENGFDAGAWAAARATLPQPPAAALQPTHAWAEPDLFRYLPHGEWLKSPRQDASGVGFRRDFDLGRIGRRDIRRAWIGVAASTPYTLIINGARGPLMPATAEYMDTFDIGNYLFPGGNSIGIETSNIGREGRIAIAAMVTTTAGIFDLSSDGNWQSRLGEGDWGPVFRMGPLHSYPYEIKTTGQVFPVPVLRLVEVPLPGGLLLRHQVEALPWVVAVLAATVALMLPFLSGTSIPLERFLAAAKYPLVLADLALAIAFLLPFDIRIVDADVFNLPTAFGVALTTAILLVTLLVEVRRGSR